jgi:hypothetical protein
VVRLVLRVLASLAVLAWAGGWSASPAAADGDPASDVLITQSLFLPQDAPVTSTQAAQLAQLLREAGRAGYKIRVAVVPSAADLGSVTELWRRPQTYAEFLAQEIGLIYHGTLLIVMPNGLGFQAPQRPVGLPQHLPAGVRTLVPGANAGTAAIAAVRALAAASGHPLRLPQVRTSDAATVRTIEDVVFLVGLAIGVVWFVLLALGRRVPIRAHET